MTLQLDDAQGDLRLLVDQTGLGQPMLRLELTHRRSICGIDVDRWLLGLPGHLFRLGRLRVGIGQGHLGADGIHGAAGARSDDTVRLQPVLPLEGADRFRVGRVDPDQRLADLPHLGTRRLVDDATCIQSLPIGTITAACVVISIPLIIMTLIFQRRIVAGLTAGSVKG